jgi:hypothetical protein
MISLGRGSLEKIFSEDEGVLPVPGLFSTLSILASGWYNKMDQLGTTNIIFDKVTFSWRKDKNASQSPF